MATATHQTVQFPPDPGRRCRPPRCLSCGYVLTGAGHSECAECGRPFTAALPQTYSRKKPYDWLGYWWPGWLFALAGTLVWAVVFYMAHWLGWGLFLGVPWTLGAIVGYSSKGKDRVRSLISMILGVMSVVLLVGALFVGGFAGVFCGVILLVIYVPVCWVGMLMGVWMARAFAKGLAYTRFEQRDHLPLLLLLIVPGLVHCGEVLFGPPIVDEYVRTTQRIEAPAAEVYDARMFYAEYERRPSLLMRLGEPRPVRVEGRIDRIGDMQVCYYTKDARLVVRGTDVRPGQMLAFEVVEQHKVEDKAAVLIGGSFAFEAVDADTTDVTLTSHYRPKLTPRALWRPIETIFGHEMHGHVLEGMRERTQPRTTSGQLYGRTGSL